ncbi:probable glutamate receptor [Homarus americanus]|uniref:probable glutamate receptor n=1 Tax=Homarus americanus TaxID=6706 RepID=UPI001C4506F1|nr:probable glutamate receptor [Homarus americanus]
MAKTAISLLCYLTLAVVATVGQLPRSYVHHKRISVLTNALESLLAAESHPRCTLIFLTDGSISTTSVFKEFVSLRFSSGVALLEVAADSQDTNLTQAWLSRVVKQVRKLRQVSWCVTVVVVSDDPAFLAAFAEWSLKGRLLVWSTRLLVVTRLPLPELHHLHKLLSMTNSMLLVVDDTLEDTRCSVFIHLPYTISGTKAMKVASWTTHQGLALTTHLPLFPDKFYKFLHKPTLSVAVDQNHLRETEGGTKDDIINFLAQAINFTHKYVVPPDNSFGSKQTDGSWSGLMGMVVREKADFALGPLSLSAARAEVVDFTMPLTIQYSRILASRGRPEIDPWGFLLAPLAPLVWVAILTTLLMLSALMFLLSSSFSRNDYKHDNWTSNSFSLFRILLQQDYMVSGWWWRRLVFAVWMLMSLVLVKSYAGTLMSVLAVRHIEQPYQTLRDLLDSPSTTMIWHRGSKNIEYIKSVESGIYREVAETESRGGIKYQTLFEFFHSADTLVRRGDHVLIDIEILMSMIISRDISKTGRCDFYLSRERLLPSVLAPIGQKNSPLVPAISRMVMTITEAGLYYQWIKQRIPNFTTCSFPPTKITVSTSLSVDNLWGMFVLPVTGLTLSALIFCLEIIVHRIFPV